MSNDIVVQQQEQRSFLTAFESFPQMMQVAEMLAQSTIVPQRYQKNPGSIIIALDMAARAKLNPLMVMQNLYTVYGTPSFSGKFAISLLRRCGLWRSIRWDYREPGNWEKGVWLVGVPMDGTPEVCGPVIDRQLAISMGWMGKNDSMWQKMPDQMARYRAASWFANTNCPEVLMGLPTVEEVQDAPESMRDVTPRAEVPRLQAALPVADVKAALGKAAMTDDEQVKLQEKREAAAERRAVRVAEKEAKAVQQADVADACGAVMARLNGLGAKWRDFVKWCEAHEVALPETGSGRDAYNAVCAELLQNDELMQEFDRELKLN